MGIGRLVIVSFQDPRRVGGGVQRRIAAEIAYLAQRGVNVEVITAGSAPPTSATTDGVSYLTIPTPPLLYPLQLVFFAARAARYLRNILADDVVEMHDDGGAAMLFAYPFQRPPRGIFVSVAHGVFRDEFAAIYHYEGLSRSTLIASGFLPISLAEQIAARRANAVIAVSQYVANRIADQYGVSPDRIHVISNGIDTSVFTPPIYSASQRETKDNSAWCWVLYVGRLHIRKGILQLLRAFHLARQTNPALRLKLVGNGPLEETLRRECQRLSLSDVVEFSGLLEGAKLAQAYRSADIVCIPSLQEGQGIVALEAQACGRPVIATLTGGLTEVVKDQQTGILVPPGEVESLAKAILKLSGNPSLRQKFGHNAAEWARSFAWENVLSPCLPLYEKMLAAARETQPND